MAKKLSKKLIKEQWEEYLGEYNQETILLYRELGDLIFLHHHSDLADSIATYGEDAINKIDEEIIPTFKKNREAIRKLFNLLGENKNCKNWDLQKRYNFIATHQPPSEEEEIKSNITEAIENALRWDIGEHHLYSCIPLEDNRFNFEIGWLKDEDGEIHTTIAGLPKKLSYLINFDNFKEGFSTADFTDAEVAKTGRKLTYKYVKGGVVLVETDFTIK